MSLPVTISNVQFPDQNYHCGPWKAPNGCIYVVLLDSTTQSPEVHKCSDFDFPASAFVVQTTGTPPASGTGETMWATLKGSKIHIAYYEDDGSNNWYLYACFDTADDTWDYADVTIDTWDDKYEPSSPGCSIAFRDDDEGQDPLVCLYNGPKEKIGGTYYDRVSYATDPDGSGAWANVQNAVDAGGEVNYFGGVAVVGTRPDTGGNAVHFFWMETTGLYIYARTLRYSSGWQLSTAFQTVADLTGAGQYHFAQGFLEPVTEYVAILYRPSTYAPTLLRVDEDSNGDMDSATDVSYTIDSNNDLRAQNQSPVGCLCLDTIGAKAYIMWSENTDLDLFRHESASPFSTWSGDGTEVEAGTCDRISCNIYARNGSLKLAYVWDDGGTIKYNEYDIGQETAPAWKDCELPVQNYKVGPFSA